MSLEIMDTIKARHLLNQIQAIKAYATCVEADLQSFLGGVGTAKKDNSEPLNTKGVDIEKIRQKARKQFSK